MTYEKCKPFEIWQLPNVHRPLGLAPVLLTFWRLFLCL